MEESGHFNFALTTPPPSPPRKGTANAASPLGRPSGQEMADLSRIHVAKNLTHKMIATFDAEITTAETKNVVLRPKYWEDFLVTTAGILRQDFRSEASEGFKRVVFFLLDSHFISHETKPRLKEAAFGEPLLSEEGKQEIDAVLEDRSRLQTLLATAHEQSFKLSEIPEEDRAINQIVGALFNKMKLPEKKKIVVLDEYVSLIADFFRLISNTPCSVVLKTALCSKIEERLQGLSFEVNQLVDSKKTIKTPKPLFERVLREINTQQGRINGGHVPLAETMSHDFTFQYIPDQPPRTLFFASVVQPAEPPVQKMSFLARWCCPCFGK